MKKIFTVLAALFASAMMMAAETTVNIIDAAGINASVTLNAGNNPYKMGETPITLTGFKGTSNFPALNYNSSNGTDLRFFKGTTCGVTFEADGNIITKIEFLKSTDTASDLGDAFSVDKGTLEGNVWEGAATSVTLTYSSSTATYKEQMYIINVTYISSTPQKELVSLVIGGEATKKKYYVGEAFNPAGLTVEATYSDASTDDVTDKVVWIIEPETFTEASDNASVTLSASYNDITTDDEITITDIQVKPTTNVTADMKIAAEPAKGIIKVSAETEDFTYILEVVGADTIGTFSLADGTLSQNYYYGIVAKDGSVRSDFADGEVTIAATETGLKLDGLMIGVDEKAYVLDWIMKSGVLDYDTNAPFDATFAYSDMSASIEDGVIYIGATNAENLTIGLELYTNPANTTIPEGTYVISDTYEAGTALKSSGILGGFLTACFAGIRATTGGISDCWFLVEGTITLSYDEYGKLKVVVDGKNSWGQPVTAEIAYEKLDPKSTVDIANAEFLVNDKYVEQYGIMEFNGKNDNYKFDLYVNAETITGDFSDAVDLSDCEITFADGSSIGVIGAYEFKVEANGKNLTLTAELLGSDTIQYNITATGYLGALEYDVAKTYDGEFAIEEVTLTQATESLVDIVGINAIGDSIYVIVEGELVGGVLAPGEYTNIVASPGFYNFNFTPSFVLNEEAIWFIQSGKLTVADNGSMTFEGLNSYDKTVTFTITTATALPTINAEKGVAPKVMLPNGRTFIINNDKHYSISGAESK